MGQIKPLEMCNEVSSCGQPCDTKLASPLVRLSPVARKEQSNTMCVGEQPTLRKYYQTNKNRLIESHHIKLRIDQDSHLPVTSVCCVLKRETLAPNQRLTGINPVSVMIPVQRLTLVSSFFVCISQTQLNNIPATSLSRVTRLV